MKWNTGAFIALIIGIVIGAAITILSPTQTPTNLYFIFFCGALAICAMILPGISGAFILLLIGKYYFMIEALTQINLPVILVFVLGCVIGLLSFSHLLSWLLHHYRNLTIALLAGFMLGSLNKVWPWKKTFQVLGETQTTMDASIWPWQYQSENGADPQLLTAILFASAGILLVVLIEKVAEKIKAGKTEN
jgi:putative membrane protein